MPRSRQDWTLLALACAAGEPVTSVQLHKGLFFLSRALPDAAPFYRFDEHRFLDRSIYEDVADLEAKGLIQVTRSPLETYVATTAGIERAEVLRHSVPHAERFLERWWAGADP